MSGGGVWEIEEDAASEEFGASGPCRGVPATADGDDVYVAVGKRNSSMDALSWALKHVAKPSSFVYLVHVFPEVHHIPTPLGMLPKSQVSPQQVEAFLSEEGRKRRELIQKFLNLCHASKVQVDTVLIESDLIAKAVVELIPVLNIKRIIVGTTKSGLRKSKKGTRKAEQIYKSAPHYCEVRIICDGKEVTTTDQIILSSSHSDSSNGNIKDNTQEYKTKDSVSCLCFSRKFILNDALSEH